MDERDIVRKLQEKVDREWKVPKPIDLEGPGPFLLPLCGMNVSALTGTPGSFLLELETAKLEQRVRIPISNHALPALTALIGHLAARQTSESGEKPN